MVIASAGSSQYTGVVYFSRLYVFPVEDAVFQNHIAVGTVFLRDAQRAGVEVDVSLPELRPCRDMSVAVEQNVPRGKGRQICNELFTWADVYDTTRFASDFRVRSPARSAKAF